MKISKKDKETVRLKFNNKCAYSGTELEPDWEINHVFPKTRALHPYDDLTSHDDIRNLYPAQKAINRYKGYLTLDEFRVWYLGNLHLRIAKLPKNPKTEKSKRHKEYMLKIANYFSITTDKPFSGKFYFEKLNEAPKLCDDCQKLPNLF